MARVFLDANILIDLVEERPNISQEDIRKHKLFISPLSVHILAYTYKYRMLEKRLKDIEKHFSIVSLDETITVKAIAGPTTDFEDNVQLHSAANADCDIFLTSDKKLLNLKFFGKPQISLRLRHKESV